MNPAFENLVCPVCGAPFTVTERSLFCQGARQHCFDIASGGYVHLNAPGKARNAHTGDDKEMIRARSAFLALGHYNALSENAAEMICRSVESPSSFLLADAGCGEGTHTILLARALEKKWQVPVTSLGFDASKTGVDLAARHAKREASDNLRFGFAAANLFSLPLPDESADLILSFFAPIAAAENRRVLRKDGILLVAASGKKHLWELRELVYRHPEEASGEIRTPEGFRKTDERTVRYSFALNSSEEILHLFQMTPFFHKTSPEDAQKLALCEKLSVTAEFILELFRKEN